MTGVALPPAQMPAWDNIPAELAGRQQWLLWKFEAKPGQAKPAKMPYYVGGGRRTGDQGSERDRQRLATLAVARAAYERSGWSGVGFAFLPDDGLVGVDIDGGVDAATGEATERTAAIIAACGSFTERSVSGKGVHIYLQGHTQTNKSNDIGLEVFCGRQFFIVTGDAWPGTVPDVRAADAKTLARLHATIDEAKGRRGQKTGAATAPATAFAPQTPAELRTRVESALDAISPDLGYNDWISVGWALREAFGEFGFGLWDAWSARSVKYQGQTDLQGHWRSFTANRSPDDAVGVIFARARDAGWKPPRQARAPKPPRANVPASAQGGSGDGGGAPPPDEPPGAVPLEDDGDDQGASAHLIRSGAGQPKDCRENVLYCLRHDPALRGLVRLNQFTELIEKAFEPPWGGGAGEWDDQDDLMLGEYLARVYRLISKAKGTLRDGVQMVARELRYNPVVDTVKAEAWDGTERLDYWTADVLGVEHTPYTALAGRLFIMGMVHRAVRPGCKFDYMLILKGPQGAKKSTVFRTLAWPWFTDNSIRMGDKDSLLAMQAIWIAESSELESMNKADQNATKQFLSSSEDLFRPPYGARMVKRPRHAVVGGTTNADTFLRDVTGDRRFWPLEVGEINIELLESIRLQLFAEALHRLRSQDPEVRRTWPTPQEERELVIPAQERFKQTDVWEDILADYVNATANHRTDDPNDPVPARRQFFSTRELFEHALQIKPDRIDGNKLMETRIANCMKALGFLKYRETSGARKRGYSRVVADGGAQAPSGVPPGSNTTGGDDEPF